MRENLDKNIIDEFEKNRDIDKWQGIIEYTVCPVSFLKATV